MNTSFDYNNEDLEDVLVEDVIGNLSYLIIYNDDYNTFDWVIQCLMEVCKYPHDQSEQLTLLIHFKGKATVKTASLDVLKPLKDAFVERGLSAVIETEVEKK